VKCHLVLKGMMLSYKHWVYHGEPVPGNRPRASSDTDDGVDDNEISDSEDDGMDELPNLVEDHYRGTYMDDRNFDTIQREEVRNFEKLLEAAQREVYPGCKKFTLLAFVVKMLHIKVLSK